MATDSEGWRKTWSVNGVVLGAEGLSKRYGARTVVENVSFSLHAGEVFGLLGPNGAGKTTIVRMLVGLVRPTRGRVTIAGHDLQRAPERALAHVGCIVERPDLYGFLTGRENLEHFARMLDRGAADRIGELAALVRMENRLEDPVRTYSLGMRQRVGIAQALLGEPEVLILDEPTNGLDPAGIREMRLLVRSLAEERGIAVLVSSHLLGEIERVCDRIAILHRGHVIAEGLLASLLPEGGSLEELFLAETGGETV
jgi:ABC-2 type transport system ATP-binding protein